MHSASDPATTKADKAQQDSVQAAVKQLGTGALQFKMILATMRKVPDLHEFSMLPLKSTVSRGRVVLCMKRSMTIIGQFPMYRLCDTRSRLYSIPRHLDVYLSQSIPTSPS